MALIPPFVVFFASLPFLWVAPLFTFLADLIYTAYYLFSPIPKHEVLQSIPVGPFDDSKESQPRRHIRFTGNLCTSPNEEIRSVADMLAVAAKKYPNKQGIGIRKTVRVEEKETVVKGPDGKEVKKMFKYPYMTPYQWRTYSEVYDESVRAGNGLMVSGNEHLSFGSRIALFASTRPEWLITFHGAMQHGVTVVTVYPSLGADALVFSLDQTEVSHVVTEAKLIDTVLKGADRLPKLRVIIYFDQLKNRKELADKHPNIRFVSYEELLEAGATAPSSTRKPGFDDLAIIMYTSGSTGNPKGVMLSHGNICALTGGVMHAVPNGPNANDTFIAFLPLAHVLELAAESATLSAGGSIGYSTATTLQDSQAYNAEDGKPAGDLSQLRPTLMASVPLVLDRIRAGIEDTVAKKGPIAQKLFRLCYWLKTRAFLMGQTSYIADALVFNNIKQRFGGRLRFLLSGGAPLSPSTQLFINLTVGCPVLQGYGLTETCAGGTISQPNDREYGKVGGPLPSTEVKLMDVPEMGYTHKDVDESGRPMPRGEICIRGPTVSMGYFKLPEKTEQEFVRSNDGSPYRWFMTGDIGQLLPDGSFRIIDRKKDLVKLAHGEYIALGNLESILSRAPVVENVCVYGDAHHTSPVALIVVNHKALIALADSLSIGTHDIDALCENQKVKKGVLGQLNEASNQAKLEKWERISAVHLISTPWTPESGLLTEAFKLKRHEIIKKYKKELDSLYSNSA